MGSGSSGSADPGVGRLPGAGGEPRGVERVGGRGFGVEDPTAVRGGRQRRRHGKLAAGAVEARSYGSEGALGGERRRWHAVRVSEWRRRHAVPRAPHRD